MEVKSTYINKMLKKIEEGRKMVLDRIHKSTKNATDVVARFERVLWGIGRSMRNVQIIVNE